MKFKAPKTKVKDTISASHHPTNVGGALSSSRVKKASKIKTARISPMKESETRKGIMRFKNLMRYLKSK
jgi:hypothetical protein